MCTFDGISGGTRLAAVACASTESLWGTATSNWFVWVVFVGF